MTAAKYAVNYSTTGRRNCLTVNDRKRTNGVKHSPFEKRGSLHGCLKLSRYRLSVSPVPTTYVCFAGAFASMLHTFTRFHAFSCSCRRVHSFQSLDPRGAAVRCIEPSPALDVAAVGLSDGRVQVLQCARVRCRATLMAIICGVAI